MVNQHFRRSLLEANAPFTEEVLDNMTDSDAIQWLELNSDDPWLFHGCTDVNGKPKFIGKREPSIDTDPFAWFRDTEETYVALRVLLGANEIVSFFHGLCFHLCQQVIEKGVKSLIALQCESQGITFVPKKSGHKLKETIEKIGNSLLPINKRGRLLEIADAFKYGFEVGKYATITGGGLGVALSHLRPIDCYMKIVYDVFKPKLPPNRTSLIDAVADGRVLQDFPTNCGFNSDNIRIALFWRNPVFFSDWKERCQKMRD